MAAEEVKGMERMLGGRKRQKREVKETRVDRWLSLPRKKGKKDRKKERKKKVSTDRQIHNLRTTDRQTHIWTDRRTHSQCQKVVKPLPGAIKRLLMDAVFHPPLNRKI